MLAWSLRQLLKMFHLSNKYHCPSNCVLATATSAIDLNLIGEKTNCPDRIIGAHFFSPAHIMPLLEIVHTPKTSPEIVADLVNVAAKIKKIQDRQCHYNIWNANGSFQINGFNWIW